MVRSSTATKVESALLMWSIFVPSRQQRTRIEFLLYKQKPDNQSAYNEHQGCNQNTHFEIIESRNLDVPLTKNEQPKNCGKRTHSRQIWSKITAKDGCSDKTLLNSERSMLDRV